MQVIDEIDEIKLRISRELGERHSCPYGYDTSPHDNEIQVQIDNTGSFQSSNDIFYHRRTPPLKLTYRDEDSKLFDNSLFEIESDYNETDQVLSSDEPHQFHKNR